MLTSGEPKETCLNWRYLKHKKTLATEGYLLAGRDLSCASFSRPILSFKPNFKSGIPERKHFIRIFPVTSHRRTLPKFTN